MRTPRGSLRDRNRAAIAADPPTTQDSDEPASPPPGPTGGAAVQEPARKPAKKTHGTEQPATPRRAATAALSNTARIGMYLTPAEFEAAKAAYLADWTNGGTADTFARWIAAAIDTHSGRTPQQRAARGRPRGRAEERTGSTRSFSIPIDVVARMRAAITADQHAGRWPSDSAWCGEAIAAAVDEARDQNEGVLPTPPARLPNRLAR